MFLARIEGTVVATVKHSTLGGCRFLIARRMEPDGSVGRGAECGDRLAWRGDRLNGHCLDRRRHRP